MSLCRGFAGIVNFESTASSLHIARHMADRLGHGSVYHNHEGIIAVCGEVVNAAMAGTHVARSTGREILAAVDGEIFSWEGVEPGRLQDRGGANQQYTANIACQEYRRLGDTFVEDVRGCFSLALWDANEGRLTLATDRLGLRSLYFCMDRSRVLFATEVKVLLAGMEHCPRVNHHAVAEFVTFGFPLGDKTLFEGIRRLLPGSVATICQSGISVRQYWRLSYVRGRRNYRSVRQWADAFTERFVGAVKDLSAAPGSYGIPLSGGLDSRCIAAALYRCDRPMKAFTIGTKGSEDLQIAARVANALHIPHQSWVVTVHDFLSWIQDGVYLTDGMFNSFDTHILFLARRLPLDIHFVLDGTSSCDGLYHYFDIPMARLLSARYSDTKQVSWSFTHPLLDAKGLLDDGELFSPEYRPMAKDYVRQSLHELLAAVPENAVDPFARTDFMDQTQRMPRYNMMGTVLLRTEREVRHPFYHPDVIDLVLQLPPELRSKEKPIQRRMLQQLVPKLGSIPWERIGLPPAADDLRIIARYGERVARRLMTRLYPARRWFGDSIENGMAIDYRGWLRKDPQLQDFVRSLLLSKRCRERGYFDPSAMRRLVEGQFAGQTDQLSLLGRLISVELWHRFFVDGGNEFQTSPHASRSHARVQGVHNGHMQSEASARIDVAAAGWKWVNHCTTGSSAVVYIGAQVH